MITVKDAPEYKEWLDGLTEKEQAHIKARITRIELDDYFGEMRHLGQGLCELKWTNGFRVYFIISGYKELLLLNGGRKNEQEKDIKRARLFIERHRADCAQEQCSIS